MKDLLSENEKKNDMKTIKTDKYDVNFANTERLNKGLFKYLVIIFWPTPDTPLPPEIKCDHLEYPPPLLQSRDI